MQYLKFEKSKKNISIVKKRFIKNTKGNLIIDIINNNNFQKL